MRLQVNASEEARGPVIFPVSDLSGAAQPCSPQFVRPNNHVVAPMLFTGILSPVECDLIMELGAREPYQIHPELDPLFTPCHPSYPGGHAAQSRAIASVIALILQRSDGTYASQIKLCQELAASLARSREFAGIHYPSDTAAGLRLADLFLDEATRSHAFGVAVGEARQEWT